MKITNSIVLQFESALLQLNRVNAAKILKDCYEKEMSVEVLEELATMALERIGDGWENGTVSLSQIYMSGVICEELISVYLSEKSSVNLNLPRIGMAVLCDYHGMGKRLVISALRAGGAEVIDFGIGLDVDEIVRKTLENKIGILLISTLMLTSALKVKELKRKLLDQGAFSVQIIVGGAPFRLDSSLWRKVGADADGKNASSVLNTIRNLLMGE